MTIDYSDTTWEVVPGTRRRELPFRVYGDQQDFVRAERSVLAAGNAGHDRRRELRRPRASRPASRLQLVHFGPERDIISDDLPSRCSSTTDGDKDIAEFLGAPRVLEALMLGTRATDAFTGPLSTPLALFRNNQPRR